MAPTVIVAGRRRNLHGPRSTHIVDGMHCEITLKTFTLTAARLRLPAGLRMLLAPGLLLRPAR